MAGQLKSSASLTIYTYTPRKLLIKPILAKMMSLEIKNQSDPFFYLRQCSYCEMTCVFIKNALIKRHDLRYVYYRILW
jgi:hypothetical protein